MDVEERNPKTRISCWRNIKWYNYLGKYSGNFLKVNIHQPYDPTFYCYDIYPREIETCIHTKAYTQIFMAVLSVITKEWKQPRYPVNWRIDEYIIVYPHNQMSVNKKKWIVDIHMHESQNNNVEWKMLDQKRFVTYDSIFTKTNL